LICYATVRIIETYDTLSFTLVPGTTFVPIVDDGVDGTDGFTVCAVFHSSCVAFPACISDTVLFPPVFMVTDSSATAVLKLVYSIVVIQGVRFQIQFLKLV
jgi:hypothetical protein